MLKTYVTKNRSELLAILKIREPEFAENLQLLGRTAQIQAISDHPTIKVLLYYHLLGQIGFSSGSIVQSRVDRKMYIVDFATISTDTNGDPINIGIVGKPQDQAYSDSLVATLIGRIEDFVSTETGMNIMADDLIELMNKMQ